MSNNGKKVSGAENVRWDLSDLYAGVDDPAIDKDFAEADSRADKLAQEYRGRVAQLDAEEMRDMIEQYEAVTDLAYRPGAYAYLHWSTNTEDAARGALMQRLTERGSKLSQKILFINVEWAEAPEEHVNAMLSNPVLAHYAHWLEVAYQYKPYTLSEPEEQILTEKAVTGRNAWVRYFSEVHSAARYEWEGQQVPSEVVLNKLYEADREVRERAAQSMTDGLKANLPASTFIFNTLLADKASDDTLRGYPTWVSSRNMSNEVEDAAVEAMVEAITSRYDIVNRYYHVKRRLLGLDELYDYDRYAALPGDDTHYHWDEARQMVLESYGAFSPRMSEIAARFFDNNWIDAPIAEGKRGGAYSAGITPSVHPYIFMNYEGTSRNVMTLAHELGHGVHQTLAGVQGILYHSTPLTVAETASVFGEMLVFSELLEKAEEPAVRLALLTGKLEDQFATVFRQTAMNRFEHAMHTARREQGELTSDQFAEHWLATQRAMFGDSLTMTDNYGCWWSYIPHFLGTPGYVYAYAFGNLLVLALYDLYQQAPDGFAETYLNLLESGSSDWPHELLKPLNVDLSDPAFWHKGLGLLDKMVSEVEELAG